jgi:hypothetical protein
LPYVTPSHPQTGSNKKGQTRVRGERVLQLPSPPQAPAANVQ